MSSEDTSDGCILKWQSQRLLMWIDVEWAALDPLTLLLLQPAANADDHDVQR